MRTCQIIKEMMLEELCHIYIYLIYIACSLPLIIPTVNLVQGGLLTIYHYEWKGCPIFLGVMLSVCTSLQNILIGFESTSKASWAILMSGMCHINKADGPDLVHYFLLEQFPI